jgi:hypothetical protein
MPSHRELRENMPPLTTGSEDLIREEWDSRRKNASVWT